MPLPLACSRRALAPVAFPSPPPLVSPHTPPPPAHTQFPVAARATVSDVVSELEERLTRRRGQSTKVKQLQLKEDGSILDTADRLDEVVMSEGASGFELVEAVVDEMDVDDSSSSSSSSASASSASAPPPAPPQLPAGSPTPPPHVSVPTPPPPDDSDAAMQVEGAEGAETHLLPESIRVVYSSVFDAPAAVLVLHGSASINDVRLAILRQERIDHTSSFVDLFAYVTGRGGLLKLISATPPNPLQPTPPSDNGLTLEPDENLEQRPLVSWANPLFRATGLPGNSSPEISLEAQILPLEHPSRAPPVAAPSRRRVIPGSADAATASEADASYQIFVRTADQTVTVQVRPGDQVPQLRDELHAKVPTIPTHVMRFRFADRRLDDETKTMLELVR